MLQVEMYCKTGTYCPITFTILPSDVLLPAIMNIMLASST
jgi:hypothetical protein